VIEESVLDVIIMTKFWCMIKITTLMSTTC